jgi:hypothetical protein
MKDISELFMDWTRQAEPSDLSAENFRDYVKNQSQAETLGVYGQRVVSNTVNTFSGLLNNKLFVYALGALVVVRLFKK